MRRGSVDGRARARDGDYLTIIVDGRVQASIVEETERPGRFDKRDCVVTVRQISDRVCEVEGAEAIVDRPGWVDVRLSWRCDSVVDLVLQIAGRKIRGWVANIHQLEDPVVCSRLLRVRINGGALDGDLVLAGGLRLI